MTLLVVDDEPQIRTAMQAFFQKNPMGFTEVLSAADGTSALRLILEREPEIIVSDVVLPGLNGLELARLVRNRGIECEIILISGRDDVEYIKSAFKSDVIDYLLKPLDVYELTEVVKKAIVRRTGKQRHQPDEETVTKSGQIAKKAMNLLKASYRRAFGVKELADEMSLSPNYLSSVFKKETGIGINQALVQIRMERATELLASTDMKIREIAIGIGIDDFNYFTRVFRKTYGVTPLEYRRRTHS